MIDAEAKRPDVAHMPLLEWRCGGRRDDGRKCNQVLTEYATDGRVALRKRCDKCGEWNSTIR